jgi:hypothetical protein
LWRPILLLSAVLVSMPAGLAQSEGALYHLYLSDVRIITVEITDSQTVILNYINLGDTFDTVQPPLLVLVDSAGNPHRGHLVEVENASYEAGKYKAFDLIKPNSFAGYTILGNFRFKAPPQKAYLKVGGRILELDPISLEDFELVAARIGELDLGVENSKAAVMRAGFETGFGSMYRAGSAESRELDRFFPDEEVVPTVLLANPAPRLPPSEASRPDPVLVVISVTVSPAGGLYDLEVKEGLNEVLDDLAVDTVRNSWIFLPAISKKKIVESRLTLNVVFQR